jgi:hypothetical protein
MGNQSKQEYFEATCNRYCHSSKKANQCVLDEFCYVHDYNHQYAMRLLCKKLSAHLPSQRQAQRRERPPQYDDRAP